MDTDQDDAGEAKRLKLPKRIAGVKLPKALRHAAEDALEQIASPAGRLLLASALEAAAAALRRGAREAADARAPGASTVDRIGPMIGLAANALGSWLGEAARKPAVAPHEEQAGEDVSKPH